MVKKIEKPDHTQEEKKEQTKPHRLYRSETNKIIAGVAGGLSDYFDLDPTLIRIVFILLTIFHGSGILLYVILWVILPKEHTLDMPSRDTMKENMDEIGHHMRGFTQRMRTNDPSSGRMWVGVLIIFLGLIFLGQNFGLFYNIDIGRFWPLILIAFGIVMVFR